MKVNTKNYAVALYEATKETKGENLKAAIKNFVRLLIDKNLLAHVPKIIADFQKHRAEAEGIIKVQMETAKELSELEKKAIERKIKAATKKEVELISLVNKDLIGGLKIFYADNLIDGSLKNQLYNLKQQLLESSTKN